MLTQAMTMNASTKTPMAMNIRGDTSLMAVAGVTVPMSMPTKSGVSVPARELHEPPAWMSWLPRLPPPPRRLSIGLTTVLSIQTQKPLMKAPKR